MPVNRDKFTKDTFFGSLYIWFVFTALGWAWGELTKPYQRYQHSLLSNIACAMCIGVIFALLFLSLSGVVVDEKKIDGEKV